MRKPASHFTTRWAAGALVAVCILFATMPAQAHFVLKSPSAWATQDSLGNPQKSAPCGQADPGTPATATGVVSAFRPGETITVTVDETVFHPGHYRVVLATANRSELPDDPPVTAGDTPCGSTTIAAAPVFPLLADGALKHTAPFAGPQSFQVKLPTDVTCEKCTLQVVEFMSDHGLNNPGGCFYHHCADISIRAQGADGGAGAASAGAGGQGGTVQLAGGSGGQGTGGRSSEGFGGDGGRNAAGGGILGAGGLGASGQFGLAGSAAAGSPSDTGCSCRAVGRSGAKYWEFISAIAAIALLRARRR